MAKRILSKANESPANTPSDSDIKTLYVANVDPARVTEQDIRDQFYYFGEIVSLKMVPAQKCAFIEYTTHEAGASSIICRLIL